MGVETLKMRWKEATTSLTVRSLAVGEFDALADLEDIGLAAVLGLGHRLGQIGHDGEALAARRHA